MLKLLMSAYVGGAVVYHYSLPVNHFSHIVILNIHVFDVFTAFYNIPE